MAQFPTDPKKIRSRITSYQRALKKEYELYAWFEKAFDLLAWTLVLYRAGDLESALRKLHQAMLSNLYLIPLIPAEIVRLRERYIVIKRQLKHEPVGETRSKLVREAFALKTGNKD